MQQKPFMPAVASSRGCCTRRIRDVRARGSLTAWTARRSP